eukprot:6517500-Prymnesium_polylepis.1
MTTKRTPPTAAAAASSGGGDEGGGVESSAGGGEAKPTREQALPPPGPSAPPPSLEALRAEKFRALLGADVVDLPRLREMSWSGIPPSARAVRRAAAEQGRAPQPRAVCTPTGVWRLPQPSVEC